MLFSFPAQYCSTASLMLTFPHEYNFTPDAMMTLKALSPISPVMIAAGVYLSMVVAALMPAPPDSSAAEFALP